MRVFNESGILWSVDVDITAVKTCSCIFSPAPSSPLNFNGVQGVCSLQLKWQMPAGSLYSSFRLYITYVTEQHEMSFNISRINSTTAYSYNASGLIGGVGYLVKVHSVTATEESMSGATELFYTCKFNLIFCYFRFVRLNTLVSANLEVRLHLIYI